MMNASTPLTSAIEIEHLTHRYGARTALSDVTLNANTAEIFGFLGPNGSGKTTLFRVLSTLIPPQAGTVTFFGGNEKLDLVRDRDAIRRMIGVVFQSPSLDRQLTAEENLWHHGQLYGLSGRDLSQRIGEMLQRVGLADRARERVQSFSGGMRRRVELAKGLLHRPRILLLDEPSTGLDPGARIDLWNQLRTIQREQGVTVLMTTHLMEEADQCDRLAIMDLGHLRALDTPAALKSRIGGDVITITSTQPAELQRQLRDRLEIEAEMAGQTLRFERSEAHRFIPQLIESFPGAIDSVSLGKPTLIDVFLHVTGRQWSDDETPSM